jgi:hypothetical protein
MFSSRFGVVRDAVAMVLQHVEALPRSENAKRLYAMAQDRMRETESWNASPPNARERMVFMRRLLALHVEVTGLERDVLLAIAADLGCSALGLGVNEARAADEGASRPGTGMAAKAASGHATAEVLNPLRVVGAP